MKSLLTLSLSMLLLGGCATKPAPAERPYSDAEIKQFSLELLSRSGLPYEDYERIRRALTAPSHRMSNAIKDSQPDSAKRG